MKKKWLWTIGSGVGAILLLAGCGTLAQNNAQSSPNGLSPTTGSSSTKAIMAQYQKDFSNPNLTVPQAVTLLNANINQLPKTDASIVMNEFIGVMSTQQSQLGSEMQGFSQQFQSMGMSGIQDSTNPIIQGYMQALKNDHFVLMYNNGSYIPTPDVSWLLGQYQNDMDAGLQSILKFMQKTESVSFYDSKSNQLNLNVIASRIVALDQMKIEYPTSAAINAIQGQDYYYRQIYFGITNSMLDSSTNVVSDKTIASYRQAINQYPGSTLANQLTTLLKDLKQSQNKVTTNISVWVAGISTPKSIVSSQTNVPSSPVTTTNSSSGTESTSGTTSRNQALGQAIAQAKAKK